MPFHKLWQPALIDDAGQSPLALYVHWPFCRAKCPYCDFNSHVSNSVDYDAYGDALCREMAYMAIVLDEEKSIHSAASGKTSIRPLSSIFFGGGTPSLMPPALVDKVISTAEKLFGFSPMIEITAEANPTSVETEALAGFKTAGINRISMGVQALEQHNLAFLGREHTASEALTSLDLARHLFDRVSIDLIYGLPEQSMDDWRKTLTRLFGLGLDHLSLYQLTIEPGTVFYTRQRRGEIMTAPDEQAADMFDMTHQIAASHGLPAYEISNFSRAGEECRHNLIYWRAQDWLGIGPGAHGRIGQGKSRTALATRRSPQGWLDAVQRDGHGIETRQLDNAEDAVSEILMMGLRLHEGVNLTQIEARFGSRDNWLDMAKIDHLIKQDMITISPDRTGERLSATTAGRLFLNQLLAEMLV